MKNMHQLIIPPALTASVSHLQCIRGFAIMRYTVYYWHWHWHWLGFTHLTLVKKVKYSNVNLYSALSWCISEALRYGPCVTRGLHSSTCHPHTNHTCLYSPAVRHRRPLAGIHCTSTKGWPVWVDLGSRLNMEINVPHRDWTRTWWPIPVLTGPGVD